MTNTAGQLTYRAEFDPYGNLQLEWSATPNQNTKKFTGYERDAATRLDYAQARYYSAGLGRFMSPDPKGLASANTKSPMSLNRYGYTGGDPVNHVDPAGRDWLISVDLRFFLGGLGSACNIYGNGFLDTGRIYCGDIFGPSGQLTKQLLNALGRTQEVISNGSQRNHQRPPTALPRVHY